MAGIFNFRYKEKYQSNTCVVRYWFGKKYFIWKALHLKQSCDQVFRDLNNKIARVKMGTLSDDDLFSKVAIYCSKYPATVALVEVLLETDDLQKIIEFDQAVLAQAMGDPNCLNLSTEQYIPGWLKTATSNKAPQSIILPPASITTGMVSDIKSEPKKVATDQKLADVETTGFNPAQLLSKIRSGTKV